MRQQQELESMVVQQKKDEILRSMSLKNEENSNINILYEFKNSIIIFVLLLICTQPFINNYIVASLGIEYNSLYATLRVFIITIIYYLLSKLI